jgi:hypothetical protein
MMTRLEMLKAVPWAAYDSIDDAYADDPDEALVTWVDAWEDYCDELKKIHEENSND